MNANFKTLVELWEQSTERHGPRELFGTKSQGAWHWITYAEFKLEVDALRAGLASLGIAPGDRVALIAGSQADGFGSAGDMTTAFSLESPKRTIIDVKKRMWTRAKGRKSFLIMQAP